MGFSETGSLGLVGQGLLKQMVAMGRVATGALPDTARQIALTRAYFLALEQNGGITLDLPEQPFVYNQSLWAASAPIGGYLSDEPELRISDLIRSFDAMWSLHKEYGHAMAPALKAAAWICRSKGFPAAISYLFDLQKGGYVSGIQTLMKALGLLIWGRCQVEKDSEVGAALFVSAPTAAAEWRSAQFKADVGQSEAHGPVCDDAANLILDKCLSEIEGMAASRTYDDWMLSHFSLATMLEVGLLMIGNLEKKPALQMRAALDLMEEIMADAQSFYAPTIGGPLLRADFSLARKLSAELLAKDGARWKAHAAERMVLPNALRHLMDDGAWLSEEKPLNLPVEWQGLSCEMSYPIVVSLRGRRPSPQTRIRSFTPEELDHWLQDGGRSERQDEASEAEVNTAWKEAKGAEQRGDNQAGAAILRKVLAAYPWHYPCRVKFAHFLMKEQNFESAFSELTKALLGYPFDRNTWICLEELYQAMGMGRGVMVARNVGEAAARLPQ